MPTSIAEASALPPGRKGAPTTVVNVVGQVQAAYSLVQGVNDFGPYSFVKAVLADATGRIDVLIDTYNPAVVQQGETVTLASANVGADKQNPNARVLRVKENNVVHGYGQPVAVPPPSLPPQPTPRSDPAWTQPAPAQAAPAPVYGEWGPVGDGTALNVRQRQPPPPTAHQPPARPTWLEVTQACQTFFTAAEEVVTRFGQPASEGDWLKTIQAHADTLLIAWLGGKFIYEPAGLGEGAEEIF